MVMRVIVIGLPILILVIGVGALIFFLLRGIKNDKNAAKGTSGILFYHPEHGGGHKLFLHNLEIPKPEMRPFWYRQNWLSAEVPFFFFYEDKVEGKVSETLSTPEIFQCSCGYKADKKMQLHGHQMWTSKRGMAKKEWLKLHTTIEQVKTQTVSPTLPLSQFVIKPYNLDVIGEMPIITPYAIFDLNDWQCQKDFLTTKSNWKDMISMGTGVVMAVVLIVLVIVLVGEVNKKNSGSLNVEQSNSIEMRMKK